MKCSHQQQCSQQQLAFHYININFLPDNVDSEFLRPSTWGDAWKCVHGDKCKSDCGGAIYVAECTVEVGQIVDTPSREDGSCPTRKDRDAVHDLTEAVRDSTGNYCTQDKSRYRFPQAGSLTNQKYYCGPKESDTHKWVEVWAGSGRYKNLPQESAHFYPISFSSLSLV